MSTIESRLATLEAERDIMRTLASYGHALDYGSAEQWADCFTPDGVFDVRLHDGASGLRPWTRCSGRDELTTFARTHAHEPEQQLKHIVVDAVIDRTGDTATSTSYFVRIDNGSSGPHIRGFGRYRDELVRCADGRWRLRRRTAEIDGVALGAQPHLPGGGEP